MDKKQTPSNSAAGRDLPSEQAARLKARDTSLGQMQDALPGSEIGWSTSESTLDLSSESETAPEAPMPSPEPSASPEPDTESGAVALPQAENVTPDLPSLASSVSAPQQEITASAAAWMGYTGEIPPNQPPSELANKPVEGHFVITDLPSAAGLKALSPGDLAPQSHGQPQPHAQLDVHLQAQVPLQSVLSSTPLGVSGDFLGQVDEDGRQLASGKLKASGAQGAVQWQVDHTAGLYGHIQLASDGHWTYVLNNGSAAVQALIDGQQVNDQFIASVTDSAGRVQQLPISIVIQGSSDNAFISGQNLGQIQEDHSVLGGLLRAGGQLTISDPDAGQDHFTLQNNVVGVYGTFSIDAAGHWTYAADNSQTAIQQLKAGGTLTENFIISSADGTRHSVRVTLTGTNDTPTLTAQSQSVTEDGAQLTGRMVASDVDTGDTQAFSTQNPPAGFTLNADGSYSFDPADAAYQHLAAGQTQTLTIPITVTDSSGTTSTQNLSITITGSNDGAIIGGRVANNVTEDSVVSTGGMLRAGGQLTVVDPDAGEAIFVAQTGVTGSGHYGSFSIDESGHYSYTADNTQNAIQRLKAGDTLTDRFTVATADGTQQVVTITINGAEDRPVLQAQTHAVTEDGSLLRGQMIATDTDAGDTKAFSMANAVDGFTLNADGRFSFDPSHASYQHLSAGQTQNVLIPITVTDSAGATSTQNLTITLTGTNDGAVITRQNTGVTSEDSAQAVTGQLSVADADDGEAHFVVQPSTAGNYGHFSLDENGQWRYQLDNSKHEVQALKTGDSVTDSFTVTSADGTPHQVTVTVNGKDDGAVIGGSDSGTVTEDSNAMAGKIATVGQLTVTDPDAGQEHFNAQVTKGLYGTFTIDTAGHWGYSADNSQAAIQGLKAGASLTDSITVTSADGTSHTLSVTIQGSNDAPTLSAQAQSVTEDGARLTGNMVATDVDQGDTQFFSTQNPPAGFTLNPDGSYSFDPADSAYQHLGLGQPLVISIPITVTDSAGLTSSKNLVITITGSNDAPQLATTPVKILEGAAPIQGQLTATDPDTGDTLTYRANGPVAGFTLNPDGSFSFDPAHAAYNTLGAGQERVVSIPVTVVDGHGGSTTQNLDITVTGTNDGPALTATPQTVKEGDALLQGQLVGTDADSGDTLTYSTTAKPDGFTLNADGSYTFDPAHAAYDDIGLGQTRVLTIPMTVSDGHGGTATQSLQITVIGTNDAPVMVAEPARTTTEDSAILHGQLAATDPDHADTLTYRATATVPGFLINPDGSYTFNPGHGAYNHLAAGQTQVVSIPVEVTDGHGGTGTQTLQISITGADDGPSFVIAGTRSAIEGGPVLTGQLTATDPDSGDTLTYASGAQVAGFALNADGSYTFDPSHADYDSLGVGHSKTVSVPITVTDSQGQSVTQTLRITIAGSNDNPTVSAVAPSTVAEDGAVLQGRLTIADVDAGDSLTCRTSATVAGFNLNPNGSYTFDPGNHAYDHLAPGDSEVLSIPVTVSDGHGGSATQTLQITIIGSNDGPALTVVDQTVSEGAAVLHGQFAGTDPDRGDMLTYSTSATVAGFTLNADGSYSFDAAHAAYNSLGVGHSQVVSIPVTVTDSQGATATRSLQITVEGTDDAPVLTATPRSVNEGDASIQGRLTATDPDVGDALTYSTTATIAGFRLTPDGSYTFDPSNAAYNSLAAGTSQDVTIPVTVSDGHGGTTTQNLVITVAGVNDAAHISGARTGTVTEDTGATAGKITTTGTLTVTDPDVGQDHFNALVSNGHYGVFTLDAAGQWTYSADNSKPEIQQLKAGATLTDSFTVTSADGTAHTVAVTVAGSNDAPVLQAQTQAVTEDGAQLTGHMVATDVDAGDTKAFSLAKAVDGFTLNADGSYVFDPSHASYQHLAAGQTQDVVIPITVTDSAGATSTQNLTITVTGSNDTAVVSGRVANSVTEDGVVSTAGMLRAGGQLTVIDPDAGEAVFVAQTGVSGAGPGHYGSFSIDASGHYSYTADNTQNAIQQLKAGETLTDRFTVATADGTQQVVTITINGAEDKPVLQAQTHAVTEDGARLTGQMLATDVDAGDTQRFSVAHPVAGFVLNPDGSFSFNPATASYQHLAAGQTQDVVIPITVIDSAGGTSTQNLTITVTGTNDGAVIAGTNTGTVTEDSAVQSDQLQASGQLTITDADTGEAHFTAQTNAAGIYGSFSLDATGAWTYTADNTQTAVQQLKVGDSLTDTLTVTSADGTSHTVTVTLQGTNDAPLLAAQTQAVTEDGTLLQGRMVATDVDAHDTQTFSIAQPVDGFTLNTDGSYSFDPSHASYQHLAAGQTQDVVIPVTVTDSAGATATQNLTIRLTGTNDAPHISGADVGRVVEDQTLSVNGQLQISDADDGQAHFVAQTATAGSYGSLTLSEDGHWQYQLDNSKPEVQALKSTETATDTFTVHSADGSSHSITITIQGQRDNVVIGGVDVGVVKEDVSAVTGGHLVATGESAEFVPLQQRTTLGDFSMDADGAWTYTLDNSRIGTQALKAGETATDAVSITHTDGTTHTINITVMGSNDAPVLSAQTQAVTEDGTRLIGHMVATDVDLGETQTFSLANPVDGFTLNADGSYQFDPTHASYQHLAAGQTQDVVIPVTVTDSAGATSTQNLTITVTGTNDTAVIGGRIANFVTEDGVVSTAGMLRAGGQLTVVDPDAGEAVFVAQTGVSGAGHYGSFSIDSSGHYSYTADNTQNAIQQLKAGETLTDRFTVATADGTQQVVTITINGTEDKPVLQAQSQSVTEDGSLLRGQMVATDVDAGDTQRFSVAHPVAGFVLNPDGSYTFNPAHAAYQHLAAGQTQDVVIPITVIDSGGGTSTENLTITVAGTNDAPDIRSTRASARMVYVDAPSISITGQLHVRDTDDGDTQTWSVSGGGQGHFGHLDFDAQTGRWTYQLDKSDADTQALKAGEQAQEAFQITVTDGSGASSSTVVRVMVVGTNDAPVLTAQSQTVTEDGVQLSGHMVATDVDAGDTQSFSIANAVDGFTLNADGSYSFDPSNSAYQHLAAGQTEDLVIPVTVTDSAGASHTQNLTITITGTNDGALIGGAFTGAVTEDQSVQSGQLQASGQLTITDADSGESHFIPQTDVLGSDGLGRFSLDAQGHWSYSADNSQKAIQQLGVGATLNDSFTVQGADGALHTVTVTLTGSNDAPQFHLQVAPDYHPEVESSDVLPLVINNIGSSRIAQYLDIQQILQGQAPIGAYANTCVTVSLGGLALIGPDGQAAQVFAAGQEFKLQTLVDWQQQGPGHEFRVFGPKGTVGLDISFHDAGDPNHITGPQGQASLYVNQVSIWPPFHAWQASASTGTASDSGLLTATEGAAPLSGQFHASDIDVGDTLSYSLGQPVDGFTLNADGSYSFDPSNAAYQHLAAGQSETLSIPITVTDSAGASTTQTLSILLRGANDAATFGGVETGATQEDRPDALSGQLTVADADDGEAHFIAQSGTAGSYGQFSLDENGQWHYQIDNSKPEVQALRDGQNVTDSFTVRSADGTAHTVNISIAGKNDAALITGEDHQTLTEDQNVSAGQLIAHGQLHASTPDAGGDQFTPLSDLAGKFGHLSLGADGSWVYKADNNSPAVQALHAGQSATESFTVHSVDGTAHTLSLSIQGADEVRHDIWSSIVSTIKSNWAPYNLIGHAIDAGDVGALGSMRLAFTSGNPSVVDANGHVLASGSSLGAFGHDISMGQVLDLLKNHPGAQLVLDGNVGGSSGFYLHDSGNVMELHFRGLSHYNQANNPMGQVPIDGLPTPLSAAATLPDVSDSLTISVTDISVDHAGQLQTSGQLSISDADAGENHFNAQKDVAGTYGSFSIDASGHWVYSVDNGQAAVQNLQAGAQLTDSFMVTSADGSSHVVSVAVYGKNDAPVLFAQSQSVSEDGAQLSGQMHASDVDAGDTLSFRIDQAVAGFTLNADGSYSFDPSNAAYQHLAEGQTETLVIPVFVTDRMGASSVQDLSITLTGKNDATVIAGDDQRTVTEDQDVDGYGNLHVTGQLHADDPYGTAGPLQFQQQNAVQASYGHFTLNADGYWLYEADNKNPAIQQLKTGESLTDTLTAHSADGTAHTITVTIQGQDDAAAFVPQAQAAQVSSSDVYTIIGVQLMSSEHREFQFMAEVLLGNTDPRSYVSAEMSFTNTSVALRAPDGSLASVYHAAGGMTTVPLMDLRNWHNKGQGYDVVLVDATGMPVNVFPHDPGDPDKMSGFNQYVTGFSGPFNAAVVLYPDMQAASSGGAVQGSAVVPAMAPVLYDAAHVLEDNGQQISGFIEVQDADQGQSSMQPMTVHHAAHGTFSIDINGDWVYQLDSSRPDVQALKDGETLLETITVHSADGTPHTVNITIHGQSDGAVISGADTGRVIEDQQVAAAGRIETHGQLTVSDVDAGEAVFVAQNAVATKFGHFSIDASGAWRYEVDNNKAEVQALKPGGTPGETGHVFHALAEALSQSTQPGFHAVGEALSRGTTDGVEGALDLSIQGAAIVLSGPAGTTPVVYAMDAQGRSTIGVDELLSWMHQGMGYEVHLQGTQTDVQAFVHDRGDAARLHGLPLSGVAELNDPASAAQHLALQWHTAPVPGELSEVVSVASADGTTHQITLNIQGTAEDAVITGVDTGSVTEDAHVTGAGLIEAHGQLAIQDPDKGQAAFAPLHELAGQYGHLSLEASGLWTYTADNNSAALNGLSKNQSAVETFVVKSVDGTAHTINVTVNGADEKPDLWPEISRTLMAQGGWDTRGYQVIAQRMAAGDSAGLRDVVMNVFDGKPTVVDAAGHVLHTFDQGTKFFGYRVPMDELCQQLKVHPGAMLVMQGSVGGSAGYFFHNAGDEGMLRFEGAYMNQPANHLLGSVPINGLPQANAGGAAHGNAAAQLGGADSGSVLADGDAQLQTQGHMTVLDADGGQAHFTAQHGVHGHYGQFSIDAQGSWHYQADGHQGVLQQLAAGQALSDSFSVTSADGSSHTVTVQLFGSRVATAAVISGVDSGSVVEDAAQAVVGGQLSIVDPDPGEAHFIAQADVPAQHGHFSLQDNGAWTYTLDNKSATVQALKAGESFTEHLTVSSVDGSTHVLTVTVQGSNDTPMLQAQSQSVTEDGSLLRGQMAAQDVDHGDALHFSTPNAVGGFTLNADGSYSFDPSHHDYQSLTAGQVRDIDIPITVTDSAGATATQLLSIHITGRNDSTFIYGVDSGQVQAGVHPQTSGDLHASDDDVGQSGFQAGTVKGSFGSLSIDAQGHWTYQVDGHDSFVQHLLPNSHITEQLTVHSVDGTAHDIEVEVSGPPGGSQLSDPADSVNVQHVALPQVWDAYQAQTGASQGGHDVFAGIQDAVRTAGYQYQGLADELDKGSLATFANLDISITGVRVQVIDAAGHLVQNLSPTAENAATLHMSDVLDWHAQGHSIIATSESGLDTARMWLHNTGDMHNIQVILPDGTGFNGWVGEYTFGELSLNAPQPSPAPPSNGAAYEQPFDFAEDHFNTSLEVVSVETANHESLDSSDRTEHASHSEAWRIEQNDLAQTSVALTTEPGQPQLTNDHPSPVQDYLHFADMSMSTAGASQVPESFSAAQDYLALAGVHSSETLPAADLLPPTDVLIDIHRTEIADSHATFTQDSADLQLDSSEIGPVSDDENHHHGGI